MSGFAFPSLPAGVQTIICPQPAIIAGMPSISNVENKGALPPGTYNPTFSTGTFFLQQVTPSDIFTGDSVFNCDSWNFLIFPDATDMAFLSSGETFPDEAFISLSLTLRVS